MNDTGTETTGLLANMELFQGLAADALAEAAAYGRMRHLPKDTTVFVQGQTAEHCHALLTGRIRIAQSDEDGAQLIVRFIGPGEMFGTMALFTDRTYPAEAVTVVDSTEISWTEPALVKLIEAHPRIGLNLVRIAGIRLKEAQERLRELATQRVERRVAHTVLRLAKQTGQTEGSDASIDFPVTRKDIAEMCGTTLHTVSRIFSAWEKAGWIFSARERIIIKNVTEIARTAEKSM